MTADQREQVIAEACDLLADRVLERSDRRPDNPRRYLQAVRAGKITDHRRAAHTHLLAHPELGAQALADLLEPPTPATSPGVGDRLTPATPQQRASQQRVARRQAAAGMRKAKALAARPMPADGPARIAGLRRQLTAVQDPLPEDHPAPSPIDHTPSPHALRALRHLTREDP